MRIFVFLFISLLLHLALLTNLYFSFNAVPDINESARVLSVSFLKNNLQPTLLSKKLNEITDEEPSNVKIKVKDENPDEFLAYAKQTSQVRSPELLSSINPELVKNTQNEAEAINLTNYFGSTDVDMKALPQTNIDQSMLSVEGFSGLPIKVRIYVNAFGELVKVEPIAVLQQDNAFVEKLTKLLYEIKFLPAKREGLDVDSYQDLLLSFNPLPIAGTQTDLN